MRRRFLVAAWMLAACACAHAAVRPSPAPAGLAADVASLTSPAFDGRAAGTPGGDAAARYIAQRYIALGVPGAFPAVCQSMTACDSGLFQFFRVDGLGAKNVLAAIPGTDPSLGGSFIVVGAHYDHLGESPEHSLDPERQVRLRPGADDNASGSAALLELARRLASKPAPTPVLFAHFDAEEEGLLGSREFVQHPSMPLDSVVLMINLDMVGRLRDGPLQVEVTPSADPFEAVVDSLAGALGMPLRYTMATGGRSDHSSFAELGIPAIALFTGFHADYHRVTDTPDKLDYPGIERVVGLVEALVRAAGGRNPSGCVEQVSRHRADPALAVDSPPRIVGKTRVPPGLPQSRTVSVRFVVDETGAVVPGSQIVVGTETESTTDAVMAETLRWRFEPARAGPCRVPGFFTFSFRS